MGIYLNPRNSEFRRAISEDIYIDKTALIDYTNRRLGKLSRCLCVSRPRRFGKSMAADMLTAYYSRGCDSAELFAGRAVQECPSFAEHLNQHHVIRLDIQRFVERRGRSSDWMEEIEKAVIPELIGAFPDCERLSDSMRLKNVLDRIYDQTGEGFIFIIDEWDCVFRMAPDDAAIQTQYLDFLRGLFKGAAYVDLAYMTGILPIKKYGEHSAINMFDEYSMTDPKDLALFYGFTEDEVKEQCASWNVNYDDMKSWYDGYLLDGTHIYNPKSVTDALRWKKFRSYWTGTETYEALKIYIELNYDGLRKAIMDMLGGGSCRVNIRHFQNDMTSLRTRDDVLTLLVHLGYLTYDTDTEEVCIPNREISHEFLNAMDGAGWQGIMKAISRSMDLLKRTWAKDSTAVAALIEAVHSETTSVLQYNDENSLACVLTMAYYSAEAYYMKPIREFPSGKGYADIVYLPQRNVDRPALVIELKWNTSAEGAIAQIMERHYTEWMEGYCGSILLVGINYDRGTKEHTCVIEQWEKSEDPA